MRIGLKASQTKNMFEFPKQFGQEDGTEWNPLREGVFEDAAKIKIGVVGVSPGAGATFVASRIAYELARQADGVCYVEASPKAEQPQPVAEQPQPVAEQDF